MKTELTPDQVQTVQTTIDNYSGVRPEVRDDASQLAWTYLLQRKSTPWNEPDKLATKSRAAIQDAVKVLARRYAADSARITESLAWQSAESRATITATTYAELSEALDAIPCQQSDDEALSDRCKLVIRVRTIRSLRKLRKRSSPDWYRLCRRIACDYAVCTGQLASPSQVEHLATIQELSTLAID